MLTRLGVFVLWLVHFLPFRVLVGLGNTLGLILFVMGQKRRQIGLINLRLCFPEMAESQREKLVREHFKMFTRALIERTILWWSSAARINSLIRVEGLQHFEALQDTPAIILTPHFVGLDVAGQWVAQHRDVVSMYSNQKSLYLTRLLLEKRSRFGKQGLYSRQQGLRPILKALRAGKSFFYLPDQDQGIREGFFVPFFGVPAATMTTVTRLAQVTGAKVVPCVTRLLPGAEGYVLTFYPAWENFPSGDDFADTRRMNEFIEQRVMEIPEQYFWLHKRFKTRPEGEPSVYP
jgi:Kdo2-lipid IVA lauroyltransferase/acyltransferase